MEIYSSVVLTFHLKYLVSLFKHPLFLRKYLPGINHLEEIHFLVCTHSLIHPARPDKILTLPLPYQQRPTFANRELHNSQDSLTFPVAAHFKTGFPNIPGVPDFPPIRLLGKHGC